MTPDDNNEYIPIQLNYHRVQAEPGFPAVIRLLAADMISKDYIVIGDWLKDLHQSDLAALIQYGMLAEADKDMSEAFWILGILGMMLAVAEGGSTPDPSELKKVLRRLASLLACEHLARKGEATFHRHLATVGFELDDAVIVEMTVGTMKKLHKQANQPNDAPPIQ